MKSFLRPALVPEGIILLILHIRTHRETEAERERERERDAHTHTHTHTGKERERGGEKTRWEKVRLMYCLCRRDGSGQITFWPWSVFSACQVYKICPVHYSLWALSIG